METSKYLALLRGVNVGGKAKIKMAQLSNALSQAGFINVKTYIQSGNVIFSSDNHDVTRHAEDMSRILKQKFGLDVAVVVHSAKDWIHILEEAPEWWGTSTEWKHNLLILLKPTDVNKAIEAIGELKPGIEKIKPGSGVIYQSMSIELFGRTTTGKLASNPIYKQMTIRNFNTSKKLALLLHE